MKLKWNVSIILLALALLGVGQYQNTAPNQEIIVQFSDITHADLSQQTITAVKIQLKNIGADNIQVYKTAVGLRITYYSKVDVLSVRKLLIKNNLEVQLTSSEKPNKPSQENKKEIHLDVFEIQKIDDSAIGCDGLVPEYKLEAPKYYNTNFYVTHINFDIKAKHNNTSKKYRIQKNSVLVSHNTSHKIPEVRAGPAA